MNMRKDIFHRLLSASTFSLLCSADGDGGGTPDAGGGSSASSPSAPSSGGGDSGGSSGAPAEPAATSSEPASDPWAGLGQTSFEPETVEVPVAPPAPAVPNPEAVPPVQPPPAPQQQPALAQPPAPAQQVQPPGPQAQQQPQMEPQAAPMPSVADPMELAAFMVDPKNLPQVIDYAAQQYFQLSDEDVKAIETDVVTALPKLMGRVHAQAVASAMRFVGQSVPQMYERLTKTSKANTAAQDKFFEAGGKTLDRNNPKHVETAAQVVSMYRRMNPNATMEQVIQMCVPMVHGALGMQYVPGAVSPAPSQPVQPNMRPVAQAFQPAIPANGAPPQPQAPGPYDGLGRAFEE